MTKKPLRMKELRGIAKTDKDSDEILKEKLLELTFDFSDDEIREMASDSEVLDIAKKKKKKNRKAYEDLSE